MEDERRLRIVDKDYHPSQDQQEPHGERNDPPVIHLLDGETIHCRTLNEFREALIRIIKQFPPEQGMPPPKPPDEKVVPLFPDPHPSKAPQTEE